MAPNRMQKYVNQLLEDIQAAAENLPSLYPYQMDHPVHEDQEWVLELAKTPYKPIEEWTGLAIERFPPEHDLTFEQIVDLVQALHSLFDEYNWQFDLKDEIEDPVIWYRMFVDCWDDLVQYLPQAGFDIELCAGEPAACRMGDECVCLHDPPNLDDDIAPSKEAIDEDELPF